MAKFSISGRAMFDFRIDVDAADLHRADYILKNVLTPFDLVESWDNCEIEPSVIEEVCDSVEVILES